eukprot:6233163-Prymnesium_polylepis.1
MASAARVAWLLVLPCASRARGDESRAALPNPTLKQVATSSRDPTAGPLARPRASARCPRLQKHCRAFELRLMRR